MAEEEVTKGGGGKEVAGATESAAETNVEFPDLTDEAGSSAAASPPATIDEGDSSDLAEEGTRTASDLEAVFDVPVNISAVLGKTRLEVSSLLNLTRGAVIELDRKVGEAIDIYVNDRLIARGEVVLVEEKLGVTMTEIIQSDRQ